MRQPIGNGFSVIRLSENIKVRCSIERQAIRFGMSAIRGVGEGAVEVILAARGKGNFGSLFNLWSGSICAAPTRK